MIQPASRVNEVQEYYFSRKLKEVAKMNADGQDIISLAIGSPDMPPSEQTIDKLCEVARETTGHGYQPTAGMQGQKSNRLSNRKRASCTSPWLSSIQANRCWSPTPVILLTPRSPDCSEQRSYPTI